MKTLYLVLSIASFAALSVSCVVEPVPPPPPLGSGEVDISCNCDFWPAPPGRDIAAPDCATGYAYVSDCGPATYCANLDTDAWQTICD